ncbi:uncharacterized protein P884DRAFT_191098 [Thermothelomyces heterothallicus CBS 202.75]|uniref:uncharacterized protein n=1 Tax=Thermothelomyces heterothallicus CBS 202.75 TaxID=1149848 RepID=UPI00374315CE
MSAMLRANGLGGSAGKVRRVRSFSLSNASSSDSSDSENAGARLSVGGLSDSPPRVRFSSITEEIGRMSIASSIASGSPGNVTTSSPFQIGMKPSGAVFESPRMKTPAKPVRQFAVPVMDSFDENENEEVKIPNVEVDERRLTRSVTTPNAMIATPGERTLRSSSSRHEIGGIDAQGIYPPSACVFVANLPESKDDRALEAAVTREFSRFGTVFVKIRRESKGNVAGMPYAFAQYTNEENARVAMEEGRGILILGRPCRTEMVKANRTFVIYSRRGEEVTPDIAREILEPYGELSKCEMLSVQMQEAMSLPSAVLVEFAKFDPKRDLNMAVRQHDGYRIDAFDVKKRNLISRGDADEEFLRKYDVDRRSVFVGNLPVNTQKEELVSLFSNVGDVIGVNIISRVNFHGQVTRAFAFVEFSRADTPDLAVVNFNDTTFRGNVIKVERKMFKHVGTPRRVKSQAFSIKSSATPKTPKASAVARSPKASAGHFSGRQEETRAPATQQSFNDPTAGYTFAPYGYPQPAPAAPPSGVTVVGASGLPVTPSTTPFAPNPFTYAGGFWPGMSIAQDPVTGQTFWTYTPPVAGATTTNAPTESPTRPAAGENAYFHGGF